MATKQELFQRSLDLWMKDGQKGVFAPWAAIDGQKLPNGSGGGGGGGDGQGNKKPKKPKPPPEKKQWTYEPNPLDQSPYLPGPNGAPPSAPMGNASQYTIRLPREQWMLNPAGQYPEDQGYGYYQQWAMNPNAGY